MRLQAWQLLLSLVLSPAAAISLQALTLPKAVVFDLDGCLWYPDMYMLWGGGAPFRVRSDGDLDDDDPDGDGNAGGTRSYLDYANPYGSSTT